MIEATSAQERSPRRSAGLLVPADAGRQEKECRTFLGLLREAEVTTTDRCYDRGDLIYVEGEPADALYIVTKGAVKLTRTYSGSKEAILRLLGPWDVFGELVIGGEISQQAGAEALTACEVRKVPKVFVERAIRQSPEAALKLTTLLGLELARHREWASCLLPYKAKAKLANLLPILARRFGEETEAGMTIGLRLTHEELAAMIASTRESVTHTLAGLREQGVLATEGGRMMIPEPDELAEIACQPSYGRGSNGRSSRLAPPDRSGSRL